MEVKTGSRGTDMPASVSHASDGSAGSIPHTAGVALHHDSAAIPDDSAGPAAGPVGLWSG